MYSRALLLVLATAFLSLLARLIPRVSPPRATPKPPAAILSARPGVLLPVDAHFRRRARVTLPCAEVRLGYDRESVATAVTGAVCIVECNCTITAPPPPPPPPKPTILAVSVGLLTIGHSPSRSLTLALYPARVDAKMASRSAASIPIRESISP